jgi:tRNA G37 N-methylase Trm5
MLATELDKESVDCARRNVARNDLEEFITGIHQHNFKFNINPSTRRHLNSSPYCGVGRFSCRVFKF